MTSATESELSILQNSANQDLHEEVVNMFNSLLKSVDNKQALDVVVNALATNIGIVLSQVPEDYRESYLKISQTIINQSFSYGIESIDKKKWGQIGHA